MVPMRAKKRKGALHEPACSAGFPACSTNPPRFMAPMRDHEIVRALSMNRGAAGKEVGAKHWRQDAGSTLAKVPTALERTVGKIPARLSPERSSFPVDL